MLITVRDDKELSLKAKFITDLAINYDTEFLHVYRDDAEKFKEITCGEEIYLATSISGIMGYFLFNFFLKNPKDSINGFIRRLFRRKVAPPATNSDFLNVISQALYQYFSRSARSKGILNFLKKLSVPKVFLIDEFFSLNVIDLNLLKRLGTILYVSSDLAYDFYHQNAVASNLMSKFERNNIVLPDLIVACSQRDKLKYLDMGAKKVVYYPNIYPKDEFRPMTKNKIPTISIVMRGHWGSKTHESVNEVFKALGYVNESIKVNMIGIKPKNVPKNVDLHYYDFIPTRLDYLRTLSESWIGINLGVHAGGSNQRKYDYALAELVVFSDTLGTRGDLLPYEYTYIDTFDLTAKLEQFIKLGNQKINKFGAENRKYSLSIAKNKKEELLKVIKNIFAQNSAYCS